MMEPYPQKTGPISEEDRHIMLQYFKAWANMGFITPYDFALMHLCATHEEAEELLRSALEKLGKIFCSKHRRR